MASEITLFGDWKQPETHITSEFYFDYDIFCNTLESDFGDFSKLPFDKKKRVKEELWRHSWCNERMPRLYLERGYGPDATYSLFIALPHWNVAKEDAYQKSKRNTIVSSASVEGVFSSDSEVFAAENEYVHLVFDCDGTDPLPAVKIGVNNVETSDSSIEENREIDFGKIDKYDRSDYDNGGCRIPMLENIKVRRGANGQNTFSGMGRLEVIGGNKAFPYRIVYQFRINFSLRKIIRYELKKEKKQVIAIVETQSLGRPIEVCLIKNGEGRLPCLKGDKQSTISTACKIDRVGNGKDASNSKKVSLKFNLEEEVDKDKDEFLLDFVNPDDARYFMLLCRPEGKSGKGHREKKHKNQKGFRFCPYCHEPLVNLTKNKSAARNYRQGVISCQGDSLSAPIFDEKGKMLLTGGMFCTQDVNWERGMFSPEYMRLLPDGYPLQDDFKIILYGSPRSGKSLLLSNVFTVTPANSGSGEAMSTGATTIHTPLLSQTIFPRRQRLSAEEQEKSGKLSAYEIRAIESITNNDQDTQYKVSQSPWTSMAGSPTDPAAIYSKYVVGSPPKSELIPTTDPKETKKLLKCPFFVRIKRNYVSMYDMSGEHSIGNDPENQKHLRNGGRMGVIILINGMAEQDAVARENDVKIIDQVCKAFGDYKKNKDIYNAPVAVVVSKFDVIERGDSGFFSNCNCLRGDVADMYSGEYAGSELEENIETASLEIKSYLKAKRSELFDKVDFLERLVNCRYFGVSAVQYRDAIRHSKNAQNGDEYNYLRFKSSPKRLELPFLWLFHQFGLVQ